MERHLTSQFRRLLCRSASYLQWFSGGSANDRQFIGREHVAPLRQLEKKPENSRMSLNRTLRFILGHPMNRGRPISTLYRFAKWQLQSRLEDEVIFEWIDGAKLVVQRGMTGATGNIYCGLHEYADMAFLLHLLREDDLFLDLGANVGSYTVLASRVCGARSIAVEPDPEAVVRLRRNVEANEVGNLVVITETALGAAPGVARFSIGDDTMNRVVADVSETSREVKLMSLDSIIGDRRPTMIKMDVEGYEAEVLKGARETLKMETLLAVETETSDSEVIAALSEAGFERWYYDPARRELSREPRGILASNALYLRDVSHVQRRVSEAPLRIILGKAI
jgi:FkbM family methyltransferase